MKPVLTAIPGERLSFNHLLKVPFFKSREHPLYNYKNWKRCVAEELTIQGYDEYVRDGLTAQQQNWECYHWDGDFPKLCAPSNPILLRNVEEAFAGIKALFFDMDFDFGRGYSIEDMKLDSGWVWHEQPDGSAILELQGGLFTTQAYESAIHLSPWIERSGRMLMRNEQMRQSEEYSDENVMVFVIGGGYAPYISVVQIEQESGELGD